MRWIRQNPVTEDSCGQCCAAMLLDIGKRESIARVGHDEGTTTREMVLLLRAGGLRVSSRLRPFRGFDAIATSRALLLGWWREHPHWFVWNDGRVVDPVEGVFDLRRRPLPRHLKVTHYISVTPRTNDRARRQ